jgi:hypothetical protein
MVAPLQLLRRRKEKNNELSYRRLGLSVLSGLMLVCLGSAQQSSITLTNANAALCHHNNTAWTLDKTGSVSGNLVTWTVTATKGATTDNMLSVNGYVEVTNTGTAPATIGNIVVNLQKQATQGGKTYWVSAAADIADATHGDSATLANIVAAASAEDPAKNATIGAHNYAVSGAKGTFIETPGSGAMSFTDLSNTTLWNMVPQPTIAVGATVKLFYVAEFNNTILHLAAGSSIRAEAIVTFGNSGKRGGSGSSANNIDVNGNGSVDADELNVRSVPSRLTLTVPVLEACNASVTLTDSVDDLFATGSVSFDPNSFDNGGIGAGLVISDTTIKTVSVAVDPGADGGTITNTAHLNGDSDYVSVMIGHDPLGAPIYFSFPCCVGVDLSASSTITIGAPIFHWGNDDYTTHITNQWGHAHEPGTIMTQFFALDFSNGLKIGDPSGFVALYDTTIASGNDAFSALLGSHALLSQNSNPSNPAGPLAHSSHNSPSTSGGGLIAEIAGLSLNITFNDNQRMGGVANAIEHFGDLKVLYPGSPFDGMKVRDVLAAMNVVVSGPAAPLPGTMSYSDLEDFANKLNGTFQGGSSGWANAHLRP